MIYMLSERCLANCLINVAAVLPHRLIKDDNDVYLLQISVSPS